MADIVNTDVLTPRTNTSISEGFKVATLQMGRELHETASLGGELSLNQILEKVYDWEQEYEEKVTQDEIESLHTLSLMLGLVKYQAEHEPKALSVETQNVQITHDILRNVFNNLTTDGKPNEIIAKTFGLITNVFDEYFNQYEPKLTDKRVVSNGCWIGVMGMVTTALMFHNSGWEVRLPSDDTDIFYGIDLLVKNSKGEIFAVDITAKINLPGSPARRGDGLYFVSKGPPTPVLKTGVEGLTGMIRINVPPLMSQDANAFYENRKTGYPTAEALKKFETVLGK